MSKQASSETSEAQGPYGIRHAITTGGLMRSARDMLELTQSDLARMTGIAQSHLSAIENGRQSLGVERAELIGRALDIHPGVLLWPNEELRSTADLRRLMKRVEALREEQAPAERVTG